MPSFSPSQISPVRQTFSNANATIDPATTVMAQTGTMSAARVLTLPAANSVPAGSFIVIIDESGSATGVNNVGVIRSGTDLVNGASTTQNAVSTAYGGARVFSNGVDRWTVVRP